MRVLIVDDSPHILSRLVDALSEISCVTSTQTANNANDAYNLVCNNDYDLVLLDINMPGKNGLVLLKEIKAAFPHIKTMMVTNQSAEYYKPICMQLGADFFIDKSTEFESIQDHITQLCHQP